MIETALINILTNDPGVSGIVGGRVRPFTDANTTAYPCLTYWRSNTDRPISNDGPTGQSIAIFQLDAWAADAATCWQVSNAVRLATNGKSGTLYGTQIDSIRWQDETDQINTPVLPGKQKATQRRTATVVISYAEKLNEPAFSAGFCSAFE
jgi:hypothetical protein